MIVGGRSKAAQGESSRTGINRTVPQTIQAVQQLRSVRLLGPSFKAFDLRRSGDSALQRPSSRTLGTVPMVPLYDGSGKNVLRTVRFDCFCGGMTEENSSIDTGSRPTHVGHLRTVGYGRCANRIQQGRDQEIPAAGY
ncbi:hypothetical protein FGB62_24g27 [Gracilaria domingensis]|nr:hypothetical protein FGB62_24g27 [Gracilaria domingensis]